MSLWRSVSFACLAASLACSSSSSPGSGSGSGAGSSTASHAGSTVALASGGCAALAVCCQSSGLSSNDQSACATVADGGIDEACDSALGSFEDKGECTPVDASTSVDAGGCSGSACCTMLKTCCESVLVPAPQKANCGPIVADGIASVCSTTLTALESYCGTDLGAGSTDADTGPTDAATSADAR